MHGHAYLLWTICCGNSSFSYLNVSLPRSVYNDINSAFAFKTQIYYLENELHFSTAVFSLHQTDPQYIKRSATVLFDRASLMICRKKIQQDVIELIICSTCFGHYYAHHQDLETIQVITACGT